MAIEKLQHYGTNLKLCSGYINSEVVVNNDTVVCLNHGATLDKAFFMFHFMKTMYGILHYHAVVINITIYGYSSL